MKAPLKKITIQVLRDLDACSQGRREFKQAFPEGWTPTVPTALPHARVLDWSWGAEELLNTEGYKLWYQEHEKAYKAYNQAIGTLDPDDPEYRTKQDNLLTAYHEARARAFVEQFSVNPVIYDDGAVEDPNVALTELRHYLEGDLSDLDYDELLKVTKKWLAFDAYLIKGGTLPDAWTQNGLRRLPLPEASDTTSE